MSRALKIRDGKLAIDERDIQRAIVDFLRAQGHLVIENRSHVSDAILARVSGNRAAKGTFDLIVALLDGLTLWIEVKRPGVCLTEEQEQFSLELDRVGHWWMVARSVEDVEHHLRMIYRRAERNAACKSES